MRNLIVTALAIREFTPTAPIACSLALPAHTDTTTIVEPPAPDMAPISTPPLIDISMGNIVEQMRAFDPPLWVRPGVAGFRVVWGEVTPPVPLEVEVGGVGGCLPHVAGVWDGKRIRVATWGKKGNKQFHRGGLEGTIVHEFAHVLQWYGAGNSIGDWYYTNHHDEQSHLFKKWESVLSPFYAGSHEAESTAEVFRVLKGYRSDEEWENNSQLLKEWEGFLRGNEVFKHFFP
jgi:hypothetical protein